MGVSALSPAFLSFLKKTQLLCIAKKKKKKRKKRKKKQANELNRASPKEEVQMVKKHMKIYLLSLAIKKIQIKTTLRSHLTPIRMAIKNTNNSKC
jgi:hypothetical protein